MFQIVCNQEHCSKELANEPNSNSVKSSPSPKIHYFRNYSSGPLHARYISRPSHPLLYHHLDNIVWRVSNASHYIIFYIHIYIYIYMHLLLPASIVSRLSLQYHLLNRLCPQLTFLWKPKFHSHKVNSAALVRKRTMQTERPPHVGEVTDNFYR
jgi:hypothetical protein